MISRKNCLYFLLSVLLHSCTSIGTSILNINPIIKEQLLDREFIKLGGPYKEDNFVFINELRHKITNLEQQGFIGGDDPLHNHIEKHLMFIFFHSLKLRSDLDSTIDDKINFFNTTDGLMWSAHKTKGIPNRMQFKLKILFTDEDINKSKNIKFKKGLLAPSVVTRLTSNDNLLLKPNDIENHFNNDNDNDKNSNDPIQIDHLIKDNNITIELPASVHAKKTKYLDWMIGNPVEIDRKALYSKKYWSSRSLNVN